MSVGKGNVNTGEMGNQRRVAGSYAPAEAQALRQDATNASQVKSGVLLGKQTNAFPVTPFPYDGYSEIYSKKNNVGAGQNNWMVPYTTDDIQYELRQEDKLYKLGFDAWCERKYDLTNPAVAKMFQEIAPDLYERKMELLDYKTNLSNQYAKIRMFGARSKADLQLEYLVETNQLQLPTGTLWDPAVTPYDEQKRNLQSGYFSIVNLLQNAWKPSYNNPADIRGDQNTPYRRLIDFAPGNITTTNIPNAELRPV